MAVFQALFVVLGAIYLFGLILASLLWYSNRDRIYLWMLLYWGGLFYYFVSKLVMIALNTDVRWELVHNSISVLMSFPAFFAILYRMHGKKNQWQKQTLLCALSLVFTTLACVLDLSFQVVAWTAVTFMAPMQLYWNLELWIFKRRKKISVLLHVLHFCFTLMCLQTFTYPSTRMYLPVVPYQFGVFMALTLAFAILLPALMMEQLMKEHAQHLEDLVEKRTQELLKSRVSAAIGEMAAGVAHEINNPLAIIHGYIRRLATDSEQKKRDLHRLHYMSSRIELAIQRTLNITRGLQLFASSESTSNEVVSGLQALLMKVKKFCEERFRTQNLQIDVQVESLAHQSYAISENTLFQILTNLLSGWVELLPGEDERRFVIAVSDSHDGLGIDLIPAAAKLPEQLLSKLNNPFEAKAGVEKGSSLSIQLATGLINNNGFRLEVAKVDGRERIRLSFRHTHFYPAQGKPE